jgi:hypothetical protein
MDEWHVPVTSAPAEPVRPTYSELDLADDLGSVRTVPRGPVPAPIEVRPPRRRLRLGWLVDVAIVAALAVAATFAARAASKGIFDRTRTFDATLHTGFGWWVARASIVGLVAAVCVAAAIYLLLFRRRGVAGRVIALVLLFALPVAAVAGAAYLVTRPASSIAPEASPFDVPDVGAVPTSAPAITLAPTSEAPSSATVADVSSPARAAAVAAPAPRTRPEVPVLPVAPATPRPTPKPSPQPSPVQTQSSGGQKQNQ